MGRTKLQTGSRGLVRGATFGDIFLDKATAVLLQVTEHVHTLANVGHFNCNCYDNNYRIIAHPHEPRWKINSYSRIHIVHRGKQTDLGLQNSEEKSVQPRISLVNLWLDLLHCDIW